MEPFSYRQGDLYCENVRAEDIAARFGSPALVYSAAAIEANVEAFRTAFAELDPLICFAVKACPMVGVLRRVCGAGCGMCATSGSDLERAWLSGARFADVVFSGVDKTHDDLRAMLDGIYSPLFQAGMTVAGRPPYYRGPVGWVVAESEEELRRIASAAQGLRITARVAVRVALPRASDPDQRSALRSRDFESKFGVHAAMVPGLFAAYRDAPNVKLAGLHLHLGTSVLEPERFAASAAELVGIAERVEAGGDAIEMLDIGGGFAAIGVSDSSPKPADYAAAVTPVLKERSIAGTKIVIEPGRAISASAAVMLVRVRDTKPLEDRELLVADAGLHARGRPRDVEGFRLVWPATVDPDHEPPSEGTERIDTHGMRWYDIVGPGAWDDDAIARGRLIPKVETGGLLAVFAAGAYTERAIAADHAAPRPA
ncbi:MAG: hypothetical protein AAF235_12195 [Planctomycetota bacterium]